MPAHPQPPRDINEKPTSKPSPHQTVTSQAVGNDANDVAMIRAADIGVIVGDGLEEVRARRQTVRVPSRPGAVVSILEQLLELHR